MKNRIKDFREKKEMSQEQLANKLNVSRQTVISLEKGRYNPSLQLAFALAKEFNCYIEDIFLYEEDEKEK